MACKPILTSPRTESQLRTVLSRLEQCLHEIVTDIETLQTDLDALELLVATLETDLSDLESRITPTGTADAAVTAGDVLYASSDGGVSPAQANADLTSHIAGIALNSAIVAGDVTYQSAGVVPGFTGLTVNSFYYLSADTPGLLVSTPDAVTGEYLVLVGLALTSTDLLLMPISGILL